MLGAIIGDIIGERHEFKDYKIIPENTVTKKVEIEIKNKLRENSTFTFNFGSSIVTGDFNNDGFNDLVIGTPNENNGAGQINIIYGSSVGLSHALPPQTFTQGELKIEQDVDIQINFN